MPAYRLRFSAPALHDQLMTKGYAALTDQNAEAYIQAFQQGDERDVPVPDAFAQIEERSQHVPVRFL